MLNKFAIGRRLGLGYGLILGILLVSTAVAILEFRSLEAATGEVKRQTDQIILSHDAYANALQAMAYTGALAGSQDSLGRETYLSQLKIHREAYQAELDSLKAMATTAETQSLLGEAVAAVGSARESNLKVLALTQSGKMADAMKVYAAESCPKIAVWNAAATQELSATVQEISRTAADLAQVSETMAVAVAAFQV